MDARSAVAYEGAARAFVAGWKEGGLRLLAGAAGDVVAERVPRPPADVIAFVPGDRERTLWRGPNTAEELARALGQRWRLPVQPLLARSRSVPPQRGLSRPARRRNVRGSFRAASGSRGRVVLVDDVYTTGATASVAAAELRRAGAHAVHVVTFARAVRR